MLAGMARMPFWRFQVFSALGGLMWALLIGLAGYFLGSNLALIEAVIRGVGIGGLVVIALIAAVLLMAQARVSRLR
jgi:membrane protein DedA with SNARE-associated domain